MVNMPIKNNIERIPGIATNNLHDEVSFNMTGSLDLERNIEQRVTNGLLRDIPNEQIVYKKLR